MKSIMLLIVMVILMCDIDAIACDEDDLTEISLKDYYPCMGGHNWCKRVKK